MLFPYNNYIHLSMYEGMNLIPHAHTNLKGGHKQTYVILRGWIKSTARYYINNIYGLYI